LPPYPDSLAPLNSSADTGTTKSASSGGSNGAK
jgi:hypothetical protein